jgi:hypothetical protein
MTYTFEPGARMVDEGEPEDGTDIQVTPPEEETAVPRSGAMKVLDRPTEVVHRLRRRYRRLNRRDKFAVLLAVLAIVMFLVIMSIWSTGGGIGGPDIGPEVRPPSDWNVDALEAVQRSGDEENTNLEGQETPYLVPLNPAPGEIYFVTSLSCQVDWTDESTPPTQVPAIGYTNQPDGFYLIIRIHDGVGEQSSDLEFNTVGSSHSIQFEYPLSDLGAPIAVANKEDARYLPQGYVENLRVDFIVVTEECGDWTSSDPFRPTIGDGGNHFTFSWSAVYSVADSTKEP